MREVGPAGRLLMELRDRGRRMRARIMGGMRRVGGRVARRNDWSGSQLEGMSKIGDGTHGEFARAPETFNYTELIDCHCSEEKGG